MPKDREDPVTDDSGTERHPAFGLISLHRIHATPGETLFQSDLRHNEYMVIEIYEATRNRGLKDDWLYPHKKICQLSLSMSQFASFVASTGIGSGVPCTIEMLSPGTHGIGHRPGLNPAPRLSHSREEVHNAANEAFSQIKEKLAEYTATLTEAGKGSTAARKRALRNLEASVDNATSNVDYTTRQLDRHAEEVVEKSRADIEAMAARLMPQTGIDMAAPLAIQPGDEK